MEYNGADMLATVAVIAVLARFDLIFVGIFYILRSLRLTD
jgi:hypothetical protein